MKASHENIIFKVHNKYYDLTTFDHPGGPIALKAANGRDATVLFESHHQFSDRDKLFQVMKKYEISKEIGMQCLLPCEDKKNMYFDWNETLNSPFVLECKTKVFQYFQNIAEKKNIEITEAIKADEQKWIEFYLLFSFVINYFYKWLQGEWDAVLLLPVFYWLAGSMFHDGSHFSVSTDWKINYYIQYLFYWVSSPFEWLHEHIIGHHCYTNILFGDPDLQHASGQIQFLEEQIQGVNNQEKFVIYSAPFFIFPTLNLKNSLLLLITNWYNGCVYKIPTSNKRQFIHFLSRIYYILLYHGLPFYLFPWYKAFIFSTVPSMIISTLFVLNSMVNHIHKETLNNPINKNWFIHQIEGSCNFGGLIHYYTSIGLNYQIEHHLFPSVNSCHFRGIQPIIQEICKKYGIKYNKKSGYREALIGVYDLLKNVSKKNN